MDEERSLELSSTEPMDIVRAAAMLRDGSVVVLPTDTVYGLGASIFQPDAVRRVFKMKGRAAESAVPVLLATAADLPIVAGAVPPIAWTLIDRFWPGALTLVLPAKASVDRAITAGSGTVAVRVPSNRACLRVLEVLGEPVIGTSANRSGDAPFVNGRDALFNLQNKPDAVVLDDAHVTGGLASTVAEVRTDMIVIHRTGGISLEDIRRASGIRVVPAGTLTDLTQTR